MSSTTGRDELEEEEVREEGESEGSSGESKDQMRDEVGILCLEGTKVELAPAASIKKGIQKLLWAQSKPPATKKAKTVINPTTRKELPAPIGHLPRRAIMHNKTVYFESLHALGIADQVRDFFSSIGCEVFLS